MSHTIRYSSSRGEVWRWYWRQWRATLWRLHVLIAVTVGIVLTGNVTVAGVLPSMAVTIAIAFVGVVAESSAIPQLLFKSSERTLHVDATGWSTKIGNRSKQRTWSEIAPVQESEGAIVLANKSGNALIIPARAFSSDSERRQFLSDVRDWQAHAG